MLYLVIILIPALSALICSKSKKYNRQLMLLFLLAELALSISVCIAKPQAFTLFRAGNFAFSFYCDNVGSVFALLFSGIFFLCGVYAFKYFESSRDVTKFIVYYLLSLGALIGVSLSYSLITMFVFFVAAALLSSPLVSFENTAPAVKASKEYVKHSLTGAALALIGLIAILPNLGSPYFAYGGALNAELNMPETLFLALVLIGTVGFASKAGLFPMHSWLPTAHPQAPTPASAVLSGLITKAGVISVIRLIYFSVGAEFLSGTFVQYALMILALFTVLMGSSLAYKQDMLKKRLAFSSVSQLSYVLCALFLMNKYALNAALLQAAGHAIVKSGLFLSFGFVIHKTNDKNTSAFKGIVKYMPWTVALTILLSLSLIGIPPFIGAVGKEEIASAAQGGVFNYAVPIVLIISAMLTACYLLPLGVSAVFKKPDKKIIKQKEDIYMVLPIAVLCVSALLAGLFMPLEVI